MKNEFVYPGEELALFGHAIHWKQYVAQKIRPYIKGDVAELGPGPGNFTGFLINAEVRSWTCIEPDSAFAETLAVKSVAQSLPIRVINGTLEDLLANDQFDAMIYLDVLEHIKQDRAELERAFAHLKTNGFLIILCPAFNFLFSPFDRAIGHFRRYTRAGLLAVVPDSLHVLSAQYLDSAGFLASLSNKVFLKQSYPDMRQIKIWDRILVRISRFTDLFFSNAFGRSVLVIAQKKKGQ